MKRYIFFALMLFSLHLGAQCIIPITEAGKTIYVPIDEIAYVVPSGSGASIVRQSGLRQLNTVESVDSIVSLCSPSLLKFTDASNGRGMAVSKTFIDRIVINTQGKAVIQTKNARIAYITFEDAADLNTEIIGCYGMGESTGIDSTFVRGDSVFVASDGNEYFTGVASGGGNGIYSGSGTLLPSDTTIVTVPDGAAIKIGNTIQSPSEITTIQDANHWGTYNGWDRATYSYGGFSGYYWFRGNGTAASKTALNVNDVMHEWAFLGQKSSTEDNYALIMKPTVDEITGGNNWGRLDFQGADFQTWLSLRRTGIRAGGAANYTTFPALRPTGSNQLWQYNTDGTGQYVTPGAMTVTNPLGGSNTLQGTIDSIYQNSNQIIVASDSFYINDQNQPVYLVASGDTITLPAAAEYTAGSGINIDTLGVISATDNSATNELQTLSLAGNNLTLSNGGGTVALPSGADGNGIYGGSGVSSATVTGNGLKFTPQSFVAFDVEAAPSGLGLVGYKTFGGIAEWYTGLYLGAFYGGFAVGNSYPYRLGSTSFGLRMSADAAGENNRIDIATSNKGVRIGNDFSFFSNFTTLMTGRPTGSNQFWQHNTDGTGEYKTPGAMSVTNPLGGGNTIQAALDSLNRPTNLTFTGSGPYTLNSSTGTDVTFSQGTGVTLTRTGNDLSISATAPPNVGGISAMYTSSGYSYTAEPLTLAVDAISLPTTVGTKSGMAKVVSGAGHGIEASFGGAATCQITAFVTLSAVDGDPFYLQVYVNGSPIYGSVYASTNADAGSTVKTANISHLAELNNGDVVTIRLHSTDSISCTILSAGLTVVKTQ